jgi:hypothetical protein
MGKRGLWTGKRLRDISGELAHLGLCVCPNTVRRLLEEMGYALHANRKSLCASSPLRDQQFGVLNYQRGEFARSGYPIISVDTKKKELVGQLNWKPVLNGPHWIIDTRFQSPTGSVKDFAYPVTNGAWKSIEEAGKEYDKQAKIMPSTLPVGAPAQKAPKERR